MTPRAKTKDEVVSEFIETCKGIAKHWATTKTKTEFDRCNGVVFSMLALIDGCNVSLPAMNLSLQPHESDKAFFEEEGENWYQQGMEFNSDTFLHELYYKEDVL